MDSRQQLQRGILWLGTASLISRVIDAVSTLALLWFLSREQLGVATIAATVSAFVEAFAGMGVGNAIVQKRDRDHTELSGLFWYCCLIGVASMLVIVGSAPWVAQFYSAPELVPLLMLAASKQLLVGAAVVPQQTINRRLGFGTLGVVTMMSTLLAAIVRIALAAMGFGPWAVVVANTANGAFTLIGVYLAQPFWPAMTLRWPVIREPVTFGLKVAGSNVLYQFYRNVDYLLVGRFLGLGPLGVYRTTFEIAMSPAIAVLNVMNRTALPVFARIADDRAELNKAFLWNLRSLGLLLAPVIAVLCVCADDILLAVGKQQWRDAAHGVRVLAFAAVLRSFGQTISMVYHAAGRPAYALYDSLWSTIVLVTAILIALTTVGTTEAVCYAWLASYPFMFALLGWLLRRIIPVRIGEIFSHLRDPAVGMLFAAIGPAIVLALDAFIPSARLRLGLEIAATLAGYSLYLRTALGIRLADIVKPRAQQPAG